MKKDRSKLKIEKKKRKPVRTMLKSMVNVRAWVAWDQVAGHGRGVIKMIRSLFAISQPVYTETFEQAVVRLRLSEEALQKKKQSFLISAIFYLLLALALWVYAVYLLIGIYIFPAILCVILASLLLVYSYREHFWYMQMSKRKLGCSFSEWLRFISRRNG